MFESRGRKSIDAYVNGELVIVKKPIKLGNGIGVLLPKEWIDQVSGNRAIKYFLLDPRDNQIIIKPCFDNIEGVDEQ